MKTADVLTSFLSHSGTEVHYDCIKANVCNVDYEDVNETVLDSVDGTILSYLSYMGVSDANIHDIVGGNEHYSTATLDGIFAQFDDMDEEAILDSIEKFEAQYKDEGEVTLDSANPPACRSGYKRKKIVKNGKQDWKCVRLFGKTHLNAKQKQALRKARMKAHTGLANIKRKKSHKVGVMHGMYR